MPMNVRRFFGLISSSLVMQLVDDELKNYFEIFLENEEDVKFEVVIGGV